MEVNESGDGNALQSMFSSDTHVCCMCDPHCMNVTLGNFILLAFHVHAS